MEESYIGIKPYDKHGHGNFGLVFTKCNDDKYRCPKVLTVLTKEEIEEDIKNGYLKQMNK